MKFAGPFAILSHRVHQTALALFWRKPPELDPNLFEDDRVRRMFSMLSPHDQRHLLAVHHKAVVRGFDAETCLTALLHDIGKASLFGSTVSVVDRILKVLGRSPAATTLERGRHSKDESQITARKRTRHHGAIGAARLRALGMKEAVCLMVEAHDATAPIDQRIIQLQEVDNTTP